jgi:hypothetical protein
MVLFGDKVGIKKVKYMNLNKIFSLLANNQFKRYNINIKTL